MAQYIDVDGKIGVKMLKGTSGATYGDMTLYTPAELTDILNDGISVYVPPDPEPPTPTELERLRVREIQREAMSRVDAIIKATGHHEFSLTIKVMKLVATGGTVPQALKDLLASIEAVYDTRDAAITNNTQPGDVVWP